MLVFYLLYISIFITYLFTTARKKVHKQVKKKKFKKDVGMKCQKASKQGVGIAEHKVKRTQPHPYIPYSFSIEIMSLFLSPALNFNFFGKKNEEKAIKFFVACYVISVDYQNFINTSTNLVV